MMLLINMKLEHTDQYDDQWQGRTSCFPWFHTGVRRYEMVLILNCTVFMASTTSNFMFLCQVQLTILCFCCKYNLQFYVFVAGTTYNFLFFCCRYDFSQFFCCRYDFHLSQAVTASLPQFVLQFSAYMLVHKYLILLTCWYKSIYCLHAGTQVSYIVFFSINSTCWYKRIFLFSLYSRVH